MEESTKEQFCANQQQWFNDASKEFWQAHNDFFGAGPIEIIENIVGASNSIAQNYQQMVQSLDAMNTLSDNYAAAGC